MSIRVPQVACLLPSHRANIFVVTPKEEFRVYTAENKRLNILKSKESEIWISLLGEIVFLSSFSNFGNVSWEDIFYRHQLCGNTWFAL